MSLTLARPSPGKRDTPVSVRVKLFYLLRHQDVGGNSGTGIVAEGVILSSGRCVMEWLHDISSVSIFESIEALIAIHGHNGKTVVIMGERQ